MVFKRIELKLAIQISDQIKMGTNEVTRYELEGKSQATVS